MRKGLKIGGKRYGAFIEYTHDAADNPCLHATVWWLRRCGKLLGYRYPSITLVGGWRPVFHLQ